MEEQRQNYSPSHPKSSFRVPSGTCSHSHYRFCKICQRCTLDSFFLKASPQNLRSDPPPHLGGSLVCMKGSWLSTTAYRFTNALWAAGFPTHAAERVTVTRTSQKGNSPTCLSHLENPKYWSQLPMSPAVVKSLTMSFFNDSKMWGSL